jgi:hypothetical protein
VEPAYLHQEDVQYRYIVNSTIITGYMENNAVLVSYLYIGSPTCTTYWLNAIQGIQKILCEAAEYITEPQLIECLKSSFEAQWRAFINRTDTTKGNKLRTYGSFKS